MQDFDEVYKLYLAELEGISACTEDETRALLGRWNQGEEAAKTRLMEGHLGLIAELAESFRDQGLPLGDLVQEANMALLLAVGQAARDGIGEPSEFEMLVKYQVEEALKEALEEQRASDQVGEELLARVNVLKDISQQMAEELGREATVEELAEKMKMTVDEIKDIMKLTLDAMSVSPDAEV